MKYAIETLKEKHDILVEIYKNCNPQNAVDVLVQDLRESHILELSKAIKILRKD